MEQTYRVVTHGLKEGFSRQLATEKLAALFKSTPERIQPFLESKDVVVKKGLAQPSAAKYREALERCGCECRIEPDKVTAAAQDVASVISEHPIIVPRLHWQSHKEAEGQSPGDPDAPVMRRLTGDLAVSFTFKDQGTDTNITQRLLDDLHITADELYTLARNNLYTLVQPVLTAQQMRIPEPGKADAASSTSTFYRLEAGGSMEASCILLAPVWESARDQVLGPLRIVVPTANTCMFCGADDPLALATMCNVARDAKAQAGALGLSDLIYTVDANGTLSVVSMATDPGEVSLSHARLREIQPELLSSDNGPGADNRKAWVQSIADQLQSGDSRAAVVVNAESGLVAAYADELDCVVLLKFDPGIARAKGWQTGTRLLTVNGYAGKERGIAGDVVFGPRNLGNYGNFRPLIADLLSDDHGRIEYRKSQICEEEWSRALQMGKRALAERVTPRDGRPLFCATPAKVAVKAPQPGKATVSEPEPAAPITFGQFAVLSVRTFLCFWFVWLGVTHFSSMPAGLPLFIGCLAIVIFGVIGFYHARLVVRCSALLVGGRS